MKPLAEWPVEARLRMQGVLTDIDDTLTTEGRLEPAVLTALTELRDAGLRLVAVTGRPTYWALPLLRLCGFDALVAENGASAFWLDGGGRLQSWFYADAQTRRQHRQVLEEFAAVLCAQFPGLALAGDAPQRVGDLAFDIGENVPPRDPAEVDAILDFMRGRGLHATASSIHAHASLARFCKQEATARLLREAFGIDDASACATHVFIGDSGNDAAMFAHYPQSIGVANVRRHLARLAVPPAYVSHASFGAGFVEAAQALLAARACRNADGSPGQ
jgi:hydroxymethylpyrimidine pyrophosphatase-like HAD family hydrolase